MRIKLFHASKEICTLTSLDDPPGISPRAAVGKILEYFRDGEWIWINNDSKAVRYDSVTSVEIMSDNSEQLSEAGA